MNANNNIQVKVTTEKLAAPSVTCASLYGACELVKEALLRNQEVHVTNFAGYDITSQIKMLCDMDEIVGHDVPEFENCLHMDSMRDEQNNFYKMADKANYLHTLLFTHDFISPSVLKRVDKECGEVVDYFKKCYWKIMQETVGYSSLEELMDEITYDENEQLFNEYCEEQEKTRLEYKKQHQDEIDRDCPKYVCCEICPWEDTCYPSDF